MIRMVPPPRVAGLKLAGKDSAILEKNSHFGAYGISIAASADEMKADPPIVILLLDSVKFKRLIFVGDHEALAAVV